MARPQLDQLWRHFPDHGAYPHLVDLYTALGGQAERNINAPGFGPNGNTCASRLSVAFNRAGAPIRGISGVTTLGTANGSRIIFRVTEFRRYLLTTLGQPTMDRATPYNDAFRGKKGIIAFTVNFSNATGHIALWNGSQFREPGHDDYAAYVNGSVRTSLGEFWELP